MPEAIFPQRGEVWLVDFPDDPKIRPALMRAFGIAMP